MFETVKYLKIYLMEICETSLTERLEPKIPVA